MIFGITFVNYFWGEETSFFVYNLILFNNVRRRKVFVRLVFGTTCFGTTAFPESCWSLKCFSCARVKTKGKFSCSNTNSLTSVKSFVSFKNNIFVLEVSFIKHQFTFSFVLEKNIKFALVVLSKCCCF